MNHTSATIAFIDLLFNLLLGITTMFIVAFLLINPPENSGQIDPPITFMVEMEWDPESKVDIDLWVRGYDDLWVGYTQKDGKYFSLERDDRGAASDTIILNGEEIIIKRNYEVVSFSLLPPGEYYVNVHYFTSVGVETEVSVKLTKLSPFNALFSGSVTLMPHKEKTVVSFVVNGLGEITDLRTDVQLPYYKLSPLPPGPGGRP